MLPAVRPSHECEYLADHRQPHQHVKEAASRRPAGLHRLGFRRCGDACTVATPLEFDADLTGNLPEVDRHPGKDADEDEEADHREYLRSLHAPVCSRIRAEESTRTTSDGLGVGLAHSHGEK